MEITQLDRIENKLDLLAGFLSFAMINKESEAMKNLETYSLLYHEQSIELQMKINQCYEMEEENGTVKN